MVGEVTVAARPEAAGWSQGADHADPRKGIILTTPTLGVARCLPGHIQPELVYWHPDS